MKYTLILTLLIIASATSFAQKDSTDITGTWRSMLEKDKKGFRFTKDGFVYWLQYDDVQGGPPKENAEGKQFWRYKVGRANGFFTIDIIVIKIVKQKQVEVERSKGIFVYLRDGRIRMALLPPGKPRPVKLISGETRVFTRQ